MSRRKQVKPIRVSDTGSMVLPPQTTVLDFSNGGANFQEENGVDHEGEPMDMHVAIISCEKCPETFPSEDALNDHVRNQHYEPKISQVDFPTAYHRLGSELQQETVFIPNGHNNNKDELPTKVKEVETPPKHQNDSQSDAGLDMLSKNDNSRIFHQDAYCEICDREFCNKYFLKTHKANKHGVYENSPFSYGNTSGFSNLPVPLPMVHQKEAPLLAPSKIAPSPPATPKVEAIIQSMIKAETPKAPPPVTVLASSKQHTETTSSASKNSTHPDMEDYCEICQKHFCNKYYLKKHKQDVHGIVPETPASSSKRNRSNFDIPFTSSATSSPIILPHTIASMANMAGLPTMPNMPGVMVLNPFMPPVAIIQAQSLLPHQQLHPQSLPQVSQPLQLSPRTDSQSSACKMASSSHSTLLSSAHAETSRNIGILNADAYCELCHKEFCNKLFLKIHKASKHGVFTDDGIEIPPAFLHMTKDLPLPKETKQEVDIPKSPSTQSSSQENYITYCKPCNKEFSNKYSYKIHCMNVHGMLQETCSDLCGEPNGSEAIAPRMDIPGSEGLLKVASEAQAASNNSNNTNASTMFGNMIAAKLADRVICDICNKELCNKYFLKAHKLKVHGIDIGLSETSEKKCEQFQFISGLKQSGSLKQDMNDMPMFIPELFAQELLARAQNAKKIDLNATPPSDKPTYEELMKLGIDPEAYCEICKKEFCSKYFLRTHKLNIHGIKSEKLESEKDRSYPLIPMMPGLPSLPMMPGFPFVPTCTSLSNMPLLTSNLPSTPSSSSSKNNVNDGYEKHTWRWKEPVNSSRVICEICNKEVCNKYFLRTHKLNKHGIVPSDKSLSPTVSGSPALSDCDTASNTSSQPDQNIADKTTYQSKPENLSMPRISTSSEKSQSKMMDIKKKEEDLPSNKTPEICHLCDMHFQNGKWLKAHIMKDHASFPRNEAVDMRLPLKQATSDECKACEVCGDIFANELTLQLHLIQEHNAKVTLKTDDIQNGDSDPVSSNSEEEVEEMRKSSGTLNDQVDYSCVLCDYKTKWLSNLVAHEEKMHNILNNQSTMFSCKLCPKSFPDELMLSYHVDKYHTDVNRSISGSPTRQELKKFKCTMCSERFGSRVICHKHFQEVHAKSKTSNSSVAKTKLSCTSCQYSTRYPQLLKRHMQRLHSKLNGNGNVGTNEFSERQKFEDVYDNDMMCDDVEEEDDVDMKMKLFKPVNQFQSQLDEKRMVKPRFSPLTH
ncbi:uncharacterized protein LOC126817140 [Patella vulgata]|uniref:uncharacterized protein LOC126817140 n=1 Tax=Patella vulgata TaxID=6465 RepID=UPI0021803A6C|nr:uncharacterized protein LOC126817140 [Patella vulgata]